MPPLMPLSSPTGGSAKGYYGTRIGRLEPLHHQVQGEVYAVDSRTIHIRGFSYDGTAPGECGSVR